jgi:tetratricopeptide (TPR) repeat protein
MDPTTTSNTTTTTNNRESKKRGSFVTKMLVAFNSNKNKATASATSTTTLQEIPQNSIVNNNDNNNVEGQVHNDIDNIPLINPSTSSPTPPPIPFPQRNIIIPVQLKQVEGGTYVGGVSLKFIIDLISKSSLPEEATMVDFVQKIVKPTTLERKESYLQFLAREQPDKVKPIADHFVSYVWGYKIVDELLAALKYTLLDKTSDVDDVFVWLDGFCVNQHKVSSTGSGAAAAATPEQLQVTFGESLKAIKSVVMVLVHWANSQYAKRIWCVFEAYMSKKSNTNVILAMSQQEEKSLMNSMINNHISGDLLGQIFSSVDVESAQAKEPADQQAILQLIREYGVPNVNVVVLGNLKSWIVQGAKIALTNCEKDSAEAGSICGALYNVHYALGEYDQSLEWSERALNIYSTLYGSESEYVASGYLNKVPLLKLLGRFEEALLLNDKAFAVYVKLLGEDHPNTIITREWKADILQAQGKLEEAVVIRDEVLQRRTQVLGKEHNYTILAMSYKADCLIEMKEFDGALKLYNQILDLAKAHQWPTNHATFAKFLSCKAICLVGMGGHSDEALVLHDEALAIRKKVYGNKHLKVAEPMMYKAACLDSLTRYDEALILYDESLAIYQSIFGEKQHSDIAKLLYFKALCLKHKKKNQDAKKLGKQALDMYGQILGQYHPTTIIVRGEDWGVVEV